MTCRKGVLELRISPGSEVIDSRNENGVHFTV